MSKQLIQQAPEEPRETRPLAPEGFGYDWRGRLVDIQCCRPGEDGLPVVFVSKLAKGET